MRRVVSQKDAAACVLDRHVPRVALVGQRDDAFDVESEVCSAVADGFASGRYGAFASAPSDDVVVSASGLATASRSADLKLAFVKGTGVFRGSMKVTFASGAATAKFSGVVVPGYKPFAVGAAYFADTDGGVSVQRGFAVEIGERGG